MDRSGFFPVAADIAERKLLQSLIWDHSLREGEAEPPCMWGRPSNVSLVAGAQGKEPQEIGIVGDGRRPDLVRHGEGARHLDGGFEEEGFEMRRPSTPSMLNIC